MDLHIHFYIEEVLKDYKSKIKYNVIVMERTCYVYFEKSKNIYLVVDDKISLFDLYTDESFVVNFNNDNLYFILNNVFAERFGLSKK
jgi:hypothetical protein